MTLASVADCRKPGEVGIDLRRLLDDWNFTYGPAVAKLVRDGGAEAMIVPSARGLGDSLTVFPDRFRFTSALTIVRTIDPDLTKAHQ